MLQFTWVCRILFQILFIIPLNKYLEVGLLNHVVILFLVFEKKWYFWNSKLYKRRQTNSKQVHREREREVFLSLFHPLKWSQYPGLVQAEVRYQQLHPDLPYLQQHGSDISTWAISHYFHRSIRRELDQKRSSWNFKPVPTWNDSIAGNSVIFCAKIWAPAKLRSWRPSILFSIMAVPLTF